jgi:hypothetical protein
MLHPFNKDGDMFNKINISNIPSSAHSLLHHVNTVTNNGTNKCRVTKKNNIKTSQFNLFCRKTAHIMKCDISWYRHDRKKQNKRI